MIKQASIAILLILSCVQVSAQSAANAPASVKINPAAAEDIKTAQDMLSKALASGVLPDAWQKSPTTYGPMLWKTLAPLAADAPALKGMGTITAFIGTKPPIQAEARAANSPASSTFLWTLLLKTYPALKTGVIRPANAKEISYYWGTIPFDIDEPFFAVDAGGDIFIVNMPKMQGSISLFWIDRVGPYDELRTK